MIKGVAGEQQTRAFEEHLCFEGICLVAGGDRASRRGGLAGRGRHVRVGPSDARVSGAVLLTIEDVRSHKSSYFSIEFVMIVTYYA